MLLPLQHQTPHSKFYHITKFPDKFEEKSNDMEGLS